MEAMEEKIVAAEAEEIVEACEAELEAAEGADAAEGTDSADSDFTEFEISGLTPAQRKRREIFDKFTTGLLILLMASPFMILIYIFLWFILR